VAAAAQRAGRLGGVKPLAFGQSGELGPGFEQLLYQLAEEGADEAAKRYLIPNRVVAKGVQLRLLRQRVVMTAQKAQADVLLHRLHYALRTGVGRRVAPRWRGSTRKASSTAQPRQGGRGLTATSMRTTALLHTRALLSTAWAARLIRAGRAASEGSGRRLCTLPCCV
jgi:hypothetical protein